MNVLSRRRERTYRMQRSGNIDANPRTFEQRAATFAAAVPASGRVTLLVSRTTSEGIVSRVLTPPKMADSGPLALAQAVGAKLIPEPQSMGRDTEWDSPRGRVVGWLEVDPEAPPTHSVQAGADPTEVARLLGSSLQPGQWVAVTLRQPSNGERRAWRKWLAHRLSAANPVHHSVGAKAMVVSVMAGGDERDSTAGLLEQVVASLPGFDVGTRVRTGPLPWVRLAGWVVPMTVVFLLAAIAWLFVPRSLGSWLFSLVGEAGSSAIPNQALSWLNTLPLLLGAASAFCGLVGIVKVFARLKGWSQTWPVAVSRSTVGVFPGPRHRSTKPHPPTREQMTESGTRLAEDGDYPLHSAAFMVGPAVVASVVAPQSGALAGSAETRERDVPPVLLGDVGPVLGTVRGQHVHLSAMDTSFGVAITGAPGTGKSKLLQGLWLADTLDRVQPCGRPGWAGRHNTVVAFETKGDEVGNYREWARWAGDRVEIVSLGDAGTLAIDMFNRDRDPVTAASLFLDSMVYAFEQGEIKGRSREALTAVLTGAFAADEEVTAQVPGLGPVRHPIRLAHVLSGGAGEELARDLYGALKAAALRLADDPASADQAAPMLVTVEKLKVLFEPFTSSNFRNLTEASRNKLDQLMRLPSWWDESRRRVSWDAIVREHRSVVINTGPTDDSAVIDDQTRNLLSGMMMHGLWVAMKRNCTGWRAQHRWVSIYCDELAVQAAQSAEVLAWGRDQGRASGIRLVAAAQRVEQLLQQVRDVFLTFPNLISYRQESVSASRSVAENVSLGEGDFTGEDIRNLAPFTAVARLDVERKLVNSFVCRIHDFEADRRATIQLLGYRVADTNDGEQLEEPAEGDPPESEHTTGEATAGPRGDTDPSAASTGGAHVFGDDQSEEVDLTW